MVIQGKKSVGFCENIARVQHIAYNSGIAQRNYIFIQYLDLIIIKQCLQYINLLCYLLCYDFFFFCLPIQWNLMAIFKRTDGLTRSRYNIFYRKKSKKKQGDTKHSCAHHEQMKSQIPFLMIFHRLGIHAIWFFRQHLIQITTILS